MKIDNTEYNANLSVIDGTAAVSFPSALTTSVIGSLLGASTLEDDNGTEYTLASFKRVEVGDSITEFYWSVEDATEAALTAANNKLTSLTSAANALSSGAPTLTKLLEFYNTTKEVLGIE